MKIYCKYERSLITEFCSVPTNRIDLKIICSYITIHSNIELACMLDKATVYWGISTYGAV